MKQSSMIEAGLRRDRLIAAAGLGLVTVLAWGWTLAQAGVPTDAGMAAMVGMATMTAPAWSASHAAMIFLMWWTMMVAMMLPSAAPLALVAIALHRRGGREGQAPFLAGILMAGYLGVWVAFSFGATLIQWGLESTNLLVPAGLVAEPSVAGGMLIAAGIYQFAPLKKACLRHCRSPVQFISAHWRPGAAGSFRLGVLHGFVCLGCCWFLMVLLFVGGVMNPFWIGGLAAYVLLEKYAPHGEIVSRATGVVLIAAGALALLRAI